MKKSIFEELFIDAPGKLKVMLSTQYRMHPQIMDSINQFYIDGNERGLNCGISNPDVIKVHNCQGVAIEQKNHIIWVDMPLKSEFHEEQARTNFSYSNRAEVESIKDILQTIATNLKSNGYGGQKQIGIISFYSSQVKLLEKELLDREFVQSIDNLSLRIGSVDRFQGIECEVIICSFVRNNSKGEIGFAKDPRRVNVALSRAKELLIIVGCSELFCSRNRSDAATEIYQTVRNTILEAGGIRHAADFRRS
jgi:superfamily I DNA and/or RNA helicase